MAPSNSQHNQYEMLSNAGPMQGLGPSEASHAFSNPMKTTFGDVSRSSFPSSDSGSKRKRYSSTRPSRWRRIGNSLWLLEFGSWLLGFGSLAGVVGVLVKYNNQPVPNLNYGITLGALISLLATIATVFLTMPLAAGIGQARWIWFRKQRSLADFELITDAARNPLSAFLLILRLKGGILTLFGALFMIVVLAVNPFVQQVVKYDLRPIEHPTATLPTASTFTIDGITDRITNTDIDLPMKAAIFRGMLEVDANKTAFNVNPQCSSGNCTWPQYSTLSVCGRCADLTSRLTPVASTNVSGDATTSLPNGLSLTWPNNLASQGFKTITINNTLTSAGLDTMAFPSANWSLIDVFAIVGQYKTDQVYGPYATECVLQFCAQNMTSSSKNGSFNEVPVGEPLYLNQDYGGINVYVPDGNKNWSVDYTAWKGLDTYLGTIFSSYVQQQNGLSGVNQWPDEVSQAVFHYMNSSTHKLDGLFDNLAASMSQRLRTASGESFGGQETVLEQYVSVRWVWMILPLVVLAAVLIFLVASMIVTRYTGLEPWKESCNAVLFHGLDDESRASLMRVEKKWEMDQMADSIQMRLFRAADGLNLMREAME